jgi:hypothetical protein
MMIGPALSARALDQGGAAERSGELAQIADKLDAILVELRRGRTP